METLTTRFTNEVFTPYLGLLKSNYRFHRAFGHARQCWEGRLTEQELVNGPFLEKSKTYALGEPVEKLALHKKTVETVKKQTWRAQSLQAPNDGHPPHSARRKRNYCHRHEQWQNPVLPDSDP